MAAIKLQSVDSLTTVILDASFITAINVNLKENK